MPCFTRIEVLEDTTINRRARKKLGLAEEGTLSYEETRRVKVEAAVMKTTDALRRLSPTAVIRRKGNELTVTVNR